MLRPWCSFGLHNLTHDPTHETVTPLEPGRRYRVTVALNDIAHRFAAGNRVRVSVGTGLVAGGVALAPPGDADPPSGGAAACVLPSRAPRPEDASLRALPPPEHTAVQPVTVLRPAVPTVARLEEDLDLGTVSLVHEEDGGKVRFADGWEFGVRFVRRFSVHPDDPAGSRLELSAVKEYGRQGGVQARIEAWQLMTSTATDYRLQASIAVSDGGRPMLARSWDETIPRDGT